MAASAWQLYNSGKRYIGNGTITLGAGNFKMALARSTSSAGVSTFTLSTFNQITSAGFEISATGGYTTGGKALVPATGQWTVGASAKQMKFTYSTVGLTFTASGSSLNDVKYAILHFGASAGTGATARKLLCFCQLSSSQFTVASPNTLTVLPAATGVFTLT
jgi:hypothetical protein